MQTTIRPGGKHAAHSSDSVRSGSMRSGGVVNCGGKSGVLERPRYFPRQLITPDDLSLEATYFRKRLRLHNRHLHGWGVVCGAAVCPVEDPENPGRPLAWHIKITPGYILGPYGDDIVLDCEHIFDLRSGGAIRVAGEYYGEEYDPWCTEIITDDLPDTVYVAVRYQEVMARQVRVQPMGCGCDDAACEYSRWQDGYEVGILTACPPDHRRRGEREYGWVDCPPLGEHGREPFGPGWPPCLPCPSSPWVVLAEVTIGAEGRILGQDIDNLACRRIVTCSAYFCPDGRLDSEDGYSPRPIDLAREEAAAVTTRELTEVWHEVESLRERVSELHAELQLQGERPPEIRRAAIVSAARRAMLREALVDEDLIVQNAIAGLNWDRPDVGVQVLGLPAHALNGLSEASILGQWSRGVTVGEVAGLSLADLRPENIEEVETETRIPAQFRQIAAKAGRVVALILRMQEDD